MVLIMINFGLTSAFLKLVFIHNYGDEFCENLKKARDAKIATGVS